MLLRGSSRIFGYLLTQSKSNTGQNTNLTSWTIWSTIESANCSSDQSTSWRDVDSEESVLYLRFIFRFILSVIREDLMRNKQFTWHRKVIYRHVRP